MGFKGSDEMGTKAENSRSYYTNHIYCILVLGVDTRTVQGRGNETKLVVIASLCIESREVTTMATADSITAGAYIT
jgi:hypothetical protein